MAMNRVSAFFFDERAKQAALQILGASAHPTDSFVFGDADDADISKLEDAGLLVQNHALRKRPVLQPGAGGGLAASGQTLTGSLDSFVLPAPIDFYAVKLQGPLIEAWRAQLVGMGMNLLEALSSGEYKIRLHMGDVAKLKALAFVESVEWLPPSRSTPQVFAQAAAPAFGMTGPSGGAKMLTFDVRLHRPEDRPKVEQWMRDHDLAISGSTGRKIRFLALEDAPEMDQLATLPEVDKIAEYVEPKLFNDVARVLLEVDAPPGHNPPAFIAQDGTGQIVAVADTGIDDQHPDFQGRIVGKIARGRQNDASDPNGHGTHVSGSVLGDGAASDGRVRGVAPKASLFFQSLLDANGRLGGLPLDLNELFDEAFQAGARIHNNSWGADTPSTYTLNSEEVDEFVRSHPDMLILVAAGNAGRAANPRNAGKGFVDWLSIGSPASCKNALTVGASRSSRPDGPLANVTWGQGWPGDFPDSPIAEQLVSGNPECLAAFSSRGPCDDFRIKPDLVAPGTDIASTRSSLAPIANYWGPYPAVPGQTANPRYAFDGGTSMATPLVSGCAALIRQYFIEQRNHQPSAALLKATLINSAAWMSGDDAIAPKLGVPNYHQGFGRVSMVRAIPNTFEPTFQIQFVDDWQTPGAGFASTGDRRRYQFGLPAGLPELRICLAYTDAPARALQNDLNLIVQHVDSGQRWTGNARLPDGIAALDTINNVEKVLIDNPPAGNYVVQIMASNLLKPPQDFALVVAGNNLPALNPL